MTDDAEAESKSDLPHVLQAAAADVIVDSGLGGFSLREVARRAGVSHAAPGYHFGDARGLLTALAIEGMEKLYQEVSGAGADEPDPAKRLTLIGQAYVRVGLHYPAHCEVVFREDVISPEDPAYQDAGLRAFGVLEATIAQIARERNSSLNVPDAAWLCWSAMQGLVQIYPKIARMDATDEKPATTTEALVAKFTNIMLAGILNVS
jgi:AcrR family transcriptional regulator